jgi:D-alanyl-D-alanine carboxypeptidase-like protein
MPTYRADKTYEQLVPSFRERTDILLKRMVARGFEPVVIDAVRTVEEAAKNAAKGSGIIDSMHCWNVAVDVIEQGNGWANPKFFKALGEEAKKLGLTWGGSWTRKPDRPHVQAIPVGWQHKVRACKNLQQVDQVCADWLKRVKLTDAGQ